MGILFELLRMVEIVFVICVLICVIVAFAVFAIGKLTGIAEWLKNKHEFLIWLQKEQTYKNAGGEYKIFLLKQKIDELTEELIRLTDEAER